MVRTIFILLSIICTLLLQGQVRPLFRIVQDDKVGYINEKGVVVINATFLGGNDFSDGLASVRANGLWGFIDETGKFIIKPQYDFATNFVRELALVYKNGNPYFINKKGEIALPVVYNGLRFLNDRKAIVATFSNRLGIIDIFSKKLLTDTVFSYIGEFKYGVAIVNEYVLPTQKRKEPRVAVIDINGTLIVPFGKYETIKPFSEGYALVEIDDPKNKDDNTDGVIDTKGKVVFERPYKNSSYIDGDFYDGYAKVILFKYCITEDKGIAATSEKDYEGFINLKGEVVFDGTNYKYVKDFSYGRAFVKKEEEDFILVDRKFKRVGNDTYRDIVSDRFQNGFAIVETKDGFGIIDTAGNFVVRPRYEEIDRVGILNGYFFFAVDSVYTSKRFGVSDLNGNVIIKPVMSSFDRNGFVNGLLGALINDELTFINKRGQIVWQQHEKASDTLKYLNIDFMSRSYFDAFSTPKNLRDGHGRQWVTLGNTPKKISEYQFRNNILAVTIDTTKIDTFDYQYLGYKLFISNTTSDTIKFPTQGSNIYLKLQAQNSKGEWKDLEYLPGSWCGDSCHTIELEPNAFWNFTIPRYHGEIQTKIRAELKYIDQANSRKEKIVYSNIIYGSINPAQFWRKQRYALMGFREPYND